MKHTYRTIDTGAVRETSMVLKAGPGNKEISDKTRNALKYMISEIPLLLVGMYLRKVCPNRKYRARPAATTAVTTHTCLGNNHMSLRVLAARRVK